MPKTKKNSQSQNILLYILYGLIGCATLVIIILFIVIGVLIYKGGTFINQLKQESTPQYQFPNEYQIPSDNNSPFNDFFNNSFDFPTTNNTPSTDQPSSNII